VGTLANNELIAFFTPARDKCQGESHIRYAGEPATWLQLQTHHLGSGLGCGSDIAILYWAHC